MEILIKWFVVPFLIAGDNSELQIEACFHLGMLFFIVSLSTSLSNNEVK